MKRWLLISLTVAALGCPTQTTPPGATTSSVASVTIPASAPPASAATGPSSAAPMPTSTLPPYKGPSGTVRGVVKITGDKPPHTPFTYPKECEAASGVYGKLFRVGKDGQLADAIVTVTHYEGYVPPKKMAIDITVKGCAFSTRSIAMTDGQHIEVKNEDPLTSYLPHLDGARSPATMVTVPRGPKIKLYSRKRGRYWLRDQMVRPFMVAHVFHFPYSTFAVTTLDGRYAIEGVPVGKVQVNVMLPQTRTLKSKLVELEVKEGDNKLDLELTFDAAKDTPGDGHGGTKPRQKKKAR